MARYESGFHRPWVAPQIRSLESRVGAEGWFIRAKQESRRIQKTLEQENEEEIDYGTNFESPL
jgi:hypothetical protein